MKLHTTIGGAGQFFQAVKTDRPKFTHHRGRTWDHIKVFVNNQEAKFWYDSTWGLAYYFEWQGQWYKVSMRQDNQPVKFLHPDLLERRFLDIAIKEAQ